MKNGIVNIGIFEAMDSIRGKYKRSASDWAKATWGETTYASRISELRLIADMTRMGSDEKTGRAFSVQKCTELLSGLKKLLGEEIVSKELKNLLAKAKNSTERMILMVLAIPEEEKDRIETIIKAVVLKDQ